MRTTVDRRALLKSMLALAGTFAATAHAAEAPPEVADTVPLPAPGRFAFPQGVASADPQSDMVVLWTRVADTLSPDSAIQVIAEVAPSEDFTTLVLTRDMIVTGASDHTLRLIVEGLQPDTTYYYRFRAGADVSRAGRTRTAPLPDSDGNVNYAFACCQSFEAGFYGAWARMIADDEAAAPEDRIAFVLFLGDFIYEVRGDRPGVDIANNPDWLVGKDGGVRELKPFPNGSDPWPPNAWNSYGGGTNAVSLADYRHLYKTYLSDPHLQEARARWPFISIWDDHEFTNDAWQAFDTYFSDGRGAQRRKVAANQAWFEFVPALLTHPKNPEASPARDFALAEVADADPIQSPDWVDVSPDTIAALASLTIYRTLRWGKRCELFLTDLRSYRSPQPADAELKKHLGSGLTPVAMMRTLDEGRAANEGVPPETLDGKEGPFPNPRRDKGPGTMLGAAQRDWFKAALKESSATWKIWANSTPSLALRLDLSSIPFAGMEDVVLGTDGWQGYPGELRELMKFLRTEGVTNVISCAGDYHLHAAGLLKTDPDSDSEAAAFEIATAGISSLSMFTIVELASRSIPSFRTMVAIESNAGVAPNFNRSALRGAFSGLLMGWVGWEWLADLMASEPNPGLQFFDAAANGYARVALKSDAAETELVAVEPPQMDYGSQPAPVRYRARFRVPAWTRDEQPRIDTMTIEGAPPIPLA